MVYAQKGQMSAKVQSGLPKQVACERGRSVGLKRCSLDLAVLPMGAWSEWSPNLSHHMEKGGSFLSILENIISRVLVFFIRAHRPFQPVHEMDVSVVFVSLQVFLPCFVKGGVLLQFVWAQTRGG